MKNSEKKAIHAVMSLHGIRTRGVWQKDLAPELALAGLIPYGLDYGNFSAIKLFLGYGLDQKVNWLAKEYDRIRNESGCERPSVIAHSFGTLQIAHLLKKYDHVVFEQVILVASIVPQDYPWSDMLNARRVTWVVNNFSGKDLWPKVAGRIVRRAGNSGAYQFDDKHRALHQVEHPHHGHSDYFSQGNFRRNWVPTLLLDKRSIKDYLFTMIDIFAEGVGLEPEKLRCFFLQAHPATKSLKVVPGLHIGDVSSREVDSVAIPLDFLGTGAAPVLAFREMREVRQFDKDIEALKASFGTNSPLHKDLKWSISLPIPFGNNYEKAIGVLVLDGLINLPNGALANTLFQDNNVLNILIQIGKSVHTPYPIS